MTYTNERALSTVRHPIQTVAAIIGSGFLLVGVAGFVPGITGGFDRLALDGHQSAALSWGVAAVSVPHNLVHAVFGVAGLTMSTTTRRAWTFLIYGGVIYAVLWLYGLVIASNSVANFVSVNTADNWLHLGLVAIMIGAGIELGRRPADADDRVSDHHRGAANIEFTRSPTRKRGSHLEHPGPTHQQTSAARDVPLRVATQIHD